MWNDKSKLPVGSYFQASDIQVQFEYIIKKKKKTQQEYM